MEAKIHPPSENIFGLLRLYSLIITGLVILTILANGLSLAVPKIVAFAIDSFTR